MSAEADTMRRAAELMRKRAAKATYFHDAVSNLPVRWVAGLGGDVWDRGATPIGRVIDDHAAQHIASWDPVMARAAADLLDAGAQEFDRREAKYGPGSTTHANATGDALINLARTYLGDAA